MAPAVSRFELHRESIEYHQKQGEEKNPQNLHQLNEVVKLAWSNIVTETCMKLIHLMPKRCNAVIKSKGFLPNIDDFYFL